MDSEQSAFMTAQQKHHRNMIYGKKQRYIEVFQCSGEDMNLVLTGGLPAPVSPAKVAPTLLSPGMLPPVVPLPPPPSTNIPPPLPPTSANQLSQNLLTQAQPPMSWDNSAAVAQQAQMIAQQNLIARQNQAQAQNDLFLMNQIAQHNFTFINQNVNPVPNETSGVLPGTFYKPPPVSFMPNIFPQHPYFVFSPRMTPIPFPRPPMAYTPVSPVAPGTPVIPTSSAGVINVVPQLSSVKRSYNDAFNEQASSAKRPAYASSLQALYPQPFYPNV